MVHRLEVPPPLAGARVQAHERLGEEVRANAVAAPVVAARRARRHVQKPALDIERHQAPDVGVAGVAPGLVFPGIGAEIAAGLRNGEENPAPLARADVERLHGTGRVELPLYPVWHAAPHDHQVLEHHRRRGLVELVAGHRAAVALGQHDAAAVAEACVRFAGRGIDRVQPVAAVEKNPCLVPVAPAGDSPVLETTRHRAPGAAYISPGIEDPQRSARLRVESRHARVRRRNVQDVPDHDGRCLELARPGAVLLEGHLVRRPLPDDLQFVHVGDRDFPGRGILGVRLVRADVRPLDHGARVPGIRKGGGNEGGERKGSGGNRSLLGMGLRLRTAPRLCGPTRQRRPEDARFHARNCVRCDERRRHLGCAAAFRKSGPPIIAWAAGGQKRGARLGNVKSYVSGRRGC